MSSTISKEAYQRLVLLHLIRQFPKGVMGSFRLQKVLYYATRDAEWPPFTFHHTANGQYSYDARQLLNEMAREDLVRQEVLRGQHDGGSHWLNSEIFESEPLENALSTGFPELASAFNRAVKEYGYQKQDDLDRIAHEDPDLTEIPKGEVLLAGTEDDEIPTLLDEEDVEIAEMLLSPDFLKEMARFGKAVAERDSGKREVGEEELESVV